jgi:hypothetical protein
MSWSEWQPLNAKSGYDGPAVYEVRILNSAGPMPVPRFLATDIRGLLSIGESRSMDKRRRQLVRAMEKCYGHSEGNLLYYLLRHTRLKDLHPIIEYRFSKEADKAAAKVAEAKMIKEYIQKFGEPPPLNCAIPDRDGEWTCEDVR